MTEEPFDIVDYRPAWPAEFQALAAPLRSLLGPLALRIDHIGSTSVPGLCSKDIIDVQITVPALDDATLRGLIPPAGYEPRPGICEDHPPAEFGGTEADWRKLYFRERPGQRRVHFHVRALGRMNQRYALLFRAYLRTHPASAAAYGELKRRLAAKVTRSDYVDIKDPVCDLIAAPAEEWARLTNWEPGPSDA